MKAIIHVNRAIIAANNKNGTDDPAIIVRTYKGSTNHKRVQINGPATFVQSMDKPLSCGAKVWVECDFSDVEKSA